MTDEQKAQMRQAYRKCWSDVILLWDESSKGPGGMLPSPRVPPNDPPRNLSSSEGVRQLQDEWDAEHRRP